MIPEIPAGIGRLVNLRWLELANNPIGVLPDEFFTLEKLEFIDLGSTDIQPDSLDLKRAVYFKHRDYENRPDYPGVLYVNQEIWERMHDLCNNSSVSDLKRTLVELFIKPAADDQRSLEEIFQEKKRLIREDHLQFLQYQEEHPQ